MVAPDTHLHISLGQAERHDVNVHFSRGEIGLISGVEADLWGTTHLTWFGTWDAFISWENDACETAPLLLHVTRLCLQ